MGERLIVNRNYPGGSGVEIRELNRVIATHRIPDTAKITIQHVPGDRPFDAAYHRLTITWEEE